MQRYIQPGTVGYLLFLSYFLVHSAFASDVYIKVDDNEVGQGILRQRGSECLVVTPAHVVENALKIDLTTADKSKYSAELLGLFPGDLGVLRLNGDHASVCRNASWSDAIPLDALLEREKEGELRTMLADGSIRIVPVDIVVYDKYRSIYVRPRNTADAISKGESGSLLYVSGQLAGMLLSAKDNIGSVLRQDALINALALFFGEEHKNGRPGAAQFNRAKKAPPAVPEKKGSDEQEFSGVIVQSAMAEHRIKLEANSPVRLNLSATEGRGKYDVELLDSGRKVVYRDSFQRYSEAQAVTIPFTAPRSDTYILRILGTGGEVKYAIKILPIASDSQLRSEANVIQVDGGAAEGLIAKGAVAEYRIKLEQNSPIRLNFSATGDNGEYRVEILDATQKAVYRDPAKRYSGTQAVTLPFTAAKSGTYFLHIIGAEGEGRYAVKALSIASDSQLRGEANLIQVDGRAVEGVIAQGAVADYRIELKANSPIRLDFSATGGDGKYKVEILDSTGRAVYQDPYKRFSVTETATIPFTASKSDTYFLQITGTEGEVNYTVRIL